MSAKAAEVYFLMEEDRKCSMRYIDVTREMRSMVQSSLYNCLRVTDETTKTRLGQRSDVPIRREFV